MPIRSHLIGASGASKLGVYLLDLRSLRPRSGMARLGAPGLGG